MTKEQFKEWFVTTDPNFPICDDIQGLTRNDGSPAFQCCSPDGMVILSNEEMQECYEARWEAWNKKKYDYDWLCPWTPKEYEEIRKLYPEDGTEYTQWQAFPKVPEMDKTVFVYVSNTPHPHQIRFDEVTLRHDPRDGSDETAPLYTYWRHEYCFGEVDLDAHYWMYAPEEPPKDCGYNVGD